MKPSVIGYCITIWLWAGLAFAQDAALLEAEAQRQQRQQQERERQQAQQLQPAVDVRLSDPAAVPAALALPDEESPCFVIHTLHIDAAQALVGRELTGAVLGLRAHWQTGRARTHLDLFAGRPLKHPVGFQASDRVYGFSLHTQF